MARSALLNIMCQAALKAGKSLIRDFGEVENLQVSLKGPGDFVTNADKKAESIIYQQLVKSRPNWGFLMEESGSIPGVDTQHRWIIDPLDGTKNFMHGIPFFAVSIGLERDGEIVAGVIYNPVMDELYTAERGSGAFLNDRRLRVARRSILSQCTLCTNVSYIGHKSRGCFLEQLAMIFSNVSGVRRMGAASLDMAYIAAGRYDGFWEFGLSLWDVAAGMIIIRESGGIVLGLDGSNNINNGDVIAGNENVYRQILKLLPGVEKQKLKSISDKASTII